MSFVVVMKRNNMPAILKEKIDWFVRDVTQVIPASKSQTRRHLKELLDESYQAGRHAGMIEAGKLLDKFNPKWYTTEK